MTKIINIIILFLTSFFFICCIAEDNKRIKPTNVPQTAKWIGGADGGHYFDIKKLQDNVFYIEIYHDTIGELKKKGYIKIIEGKTEIKSKDDLLNIINYYDNDNKIQVIINNKYYFIKINEKEF